MALRRGLVLLAGLLLAAPVAAQDTAFPPIDPCTGPNAVSVAISQTASTKIVTGVSAKRVFLCAYIFVGADAEALSWVEGTGSTCGTGVAAVVGGTTAAAGLTFAANGGAAVAPGAAWWAKTATDGDDLCLLQSGAGRVAGSLKYAVQ